MTAPERHHTADSASRPDREPGAHTPAPPTRHARPHLVAPAVLTGAAAALTVTGRAGPPPAEWIALVGLCAALCATDLYRRRLPNPLVALLACAAALWAAQIPGGPGAAALGALAGAGLYLPGHLRGGIGAGDVKLAAVVGALTAPYGAGVWWCAALAAPLLTVAAAAITAVCAGTATARRVRWPHGVALCAGLLCALALAAPVGR